MNREIHGVFISMHSNKKKYLRQHPGKKLDFIYEQLNGNIGKNFLVDYEVTLNEERPDKDKICEDIRAAFHNNPPVPLFTNMLTSVLQDIWDDYDLWGVVAHIRDILIKNTKRSNIVKQSWDTRRALHSYIPLNTTRMCSRLFEAMLTARPSEVDGEKARPLDDIDRLMLTAIACLTDLSIREVISEKGKEAAFYIKHGTRDDGTFFEYIDHTFSISMRFITSRVVDIFRVREKREAANIDELQKKLQESIKNLSKPFLVTISDENGHKIRRLVRFVVPEPDYLHMYKFSILFVYLSQYYDMVDFDKICADFNIFGGDYLRLREIIGSARPSLGRTPLKVPLNGSERPSLGHTPLQLLLPEDPIEEETLSPEAKRKKKFDKKRKLLKMIEAIDDTLEVKVNKDALEIRSPKQQAATEAKKNRRKPRRTADPHTSDTDGSGIGYTDTDKQQP